MYQKPFGGRATRWGSLSAPPDPLAVAPRKGGEGREWEGREWERRQRKGGRGRREWKGREKIMGKGGKGEVKGGKRVLLLSEGKGRGRVEEGTEREGREERGGEREGRGKGPSPQKKSWRRHCCIVVVVLLWCRCDVVVMSLWCGLNWVKGVTCRPPYGSVPLHEPPVNTEDLICGLCRTAMRQAERTREELIFTKLCQTKHHKKVVIGYIQIIFRGG